MSHGFHFILRNGTFDHTFIPYHANAQKTKMLNDELRQDPKCFLTLIVIYDDERDVRINVPTAPEVGLYLDECFFTSYNQKWKDTHEQLSMKAYVEEAEEFKLKHIYSHIAATEHKEGAVAVWLHSLNHRNYPDLGPEENEVLEPQVEESTG